MSFPFVEFVTAVRIATALIFLTAAVGKMRRWGKFEGVVANYRLLPGFMNRLVAWLLPPGELLLALSLAVGAPDAEIAAALLIGLFAVAMAINLARGRTFIDCGCFDVTTRQPLRWSLVLRNVVLVLLLIFAARSRGFMQAPDMVTFVTGALGGAAFFVVVQCASILTALPMRRRTT